MPEASCFTKLREGSDEKEGKFGMAGASKIRAARPTPPENQEIICAGRKQNSVGPLALKNRNRVSRRKNDSALLKNAYLRCRVNRRRQKRSQSMYHPAEHTQSLF